MTKLGLAAMLIAASTSTVPITPAWACAQVSLEDAPLTPVLIESVSRRA